MISMTDFSMHFCKKLLSLVLCGWLLGGWLVTSAQADGITVNKAEIRSSEEGYQLSADFEVNLNFVVQQALSRGVPIYFIGEFSLTRSRWYWLDEQLFQGEQPIKLSYNVLTRQYRISRGALFQNFSDLNEAMRVIARQNSAGIAPDLLKKDGSYMAAIRLRLDISQLPKLLQVNALTSKEWDIDSGWYRWVIRPAEINSREPKSE
jgi:hypothetical protein